MTGKLSDDVITIICYSYIAKGFIEVRHFTNSPRSYHNWQVRNLLGKRRLPFIMYYSLGLSQSEIIDDAQQNLHYISCWSGQCLKGTKENLKTVSVNEMSASCLYLNLFIYF